MVGAGVERGSRMGSCLWGLPVGVGDRSAALNSPERDQGRERTAKSTGPRQASVSTLTHPPAWGTY